jgi:hypothetical protein
VKELFSAFSTAVFHHLVSIVLPGLAAIGGWFLYFEARPSFSQLVGNNHTETAFITMLVSIFVGTIIDDLGTRVERGWLDMREKKRTHGQHQEEWWAYLRKRFDVEPTGLRHLRRLVARLKFELGVPIGLLMTVPSIWLNPTVNSLAAIIGTSLGSLLCIYLLFEAAATHALLAELRHQLLIEPAASPINSTDDAHISAA